MIEHILVATDLTHRSEAALSRAAELAKRFGAALTLLHVVEHDQPEAYVARELEQAGGALCEVSERLRGLVGGPVDVRALAGDSFEVIGDIAFKAGVDLVVLGRHRRRPLRDLFVGTTVERVIWRGTHPVLMVKRDPRGPYGRVGLATDCSEPSAVALCTAESLGLLSNAELSVIHAHIPFAKTLLAANANAEAVDDHVVGEMTIARTQLQEFLVAQGRSDLVSRLYLREGAPIAALRAFIGEREPDLLVIGTHGRTGVGRLLLGSVADEALRSLEVDLLVIPPQAGS